MQLKLKRLTDKKGHLIGSSTVFVLEAMIQPTSEENELITRFNKWTNNVWYTSDHDVEKTDMKLWQPLTRASLADLKSGYRFSFEKAGFVYKAEKVILEAIQNTLSTVRGLATFDGTERVLDVTEDGYTHVAAG